MGYSYDNGVPRSWAEAMGELVFFRHHEKGAHFPAMELPVELREDIVDFVATIV